MRCSSALPNCKAAPLTDFVVSAVPEAAQQAVEQSGIVRLSLDDQRCFAEALLAPLHPNAALTRVLARRKTLLGET